MMVTVDEAVERLLAARDPAVAEPARALIALIDELYPDAVVTVDGADIGFGAGTGYKGLVFVVTPHARHVTLGIAGGADLPDPDGILEGSGRVHRHVKIRQEADIDRPALRDVMAAALDRR